MSTVKVKICGITNKQDAKLAQSLGVDYIGLNFSKHSPRQIDVATAKEICACLTSTKPVGLFIEQTDEEIEKVICSLELPYIQLYSNNHKRFLNTKIIAALRVKNAASFKNINMQNVDYLLLDAYHQCAYGGVGKQFNWALIRENVVKLFFLAGGITVNNIKQALSYKPYAIDVCSGVEIEAGRKDRSKLIELMKEVRSYAP